MPSNITKCAVVLSFGTHTYHITSALFHSSFVYFKKRRGKKRNFVSTLICAAHETRKPTYASHHYTSLRELTDNGRTSQI